MSVAQLFRLPCKQKRTMFFKKSGKSKAAREARGFTCSKKEYALLQAQGEALVKEDREDLKGRSDENIRQQLNKSTRQWSRYEKK
jgi:hypothetical protein